MWSVCASELRSDTPVMHGTAALNVWSNFNCDWLEYLEICSCMETFVSSPVFTRKFEMFCAIFIASFVC